MQCKQCEANLWGVILYDEKKEVCNECYLKNWAEKSEANKGLQKAFKDIFDICLPKQKVDRLQQRAKADAEFTKMVKIIDYKDTAALLEALNHGLLTGVDVDHMIHNLDAIVKLSRKY